MKNSSLSQYLLFLASLIVSIANAWSQTCLYNGSWPYGPENFGTKFSDWVYLEVKEDSEYKIEMAFIETCVDSSSDLYPLMGLRSGVNRVKYDSSHMYSAEMTRIGRLPNHGDPDYNCTFFYLNTLETVIKMRLQYGDKGITAIEFTSNRDRVLTAGPFIQQKNSQNSQSTDSMDSKVNALYGEQVIEETTYSMDNRLVGFFGSQFLGKNVTSLGEIKMTQNCRKHTEVEKGIKGFFFGLFMTIVAIVGIIALAVVTIVGIYFYLQKKDPPKAEEFKGELKRQATLTHERVKRIDMKKAFQEMIRKKQQQIADASALENQTGLELNGGKVDRFEEMANNQGQPTLEQLKKNADGTDIDLESRIDLNGQDEISRFKIKKGSISNDAPLSIIDPTQDTQSQFNLNSNRQGQEGAATNANQTLEVTGVIEED